MRVETIDKEENSYKQKKTRLSDENKSKTFLHSSILISMIMFGSVTLFEF
ncbi:MAG: hypothetical protein HZR80_10365 [Candidatus Heimdallarchaeota archaeon]